MVYPISGRAGAFLTKKVTGTGREGGRPAQKKPPRNTRRLKFDSLRDVLLGDVTGNELGHLEHRDGLLATEDRLQLVVGVDLGLHLLVLETVLLDVGPELLGELRAGSGAAPTTAARAASGVTGFMNAAFGLRADFLAIVDLGLKCFPSKARHF
jgi:hypothetical protein